MVTLLHLSDLHFGDDRDGTARTLRTKAFELMLGELGKLEDGWNPNVLVISGDLTCKGKPEGYTELATWLTETLFPATGLTAADCIICPGNHDIDQKKARFVPGYTTDAELADGLLRPEDLVEGLARPFGMFVKFAEDLRIPAPKLGGESNHLAGLRELRGIQFVCLNSAWFCRNSATDRSRLWLGLPQLKVMLPFGLDGYDKGPLRVAVVHHPDSWLADPEINSYSDRSNTYTYLALRSHAILSGHTHGSIEGPTRWDGRARRFLSGAGYESEKYRNNFAILRINTEERSVERRVWEFDPRVPKWEEKGQHSYSLRAETPVAGLGNPAKYIAWLRDQTHSINLNELKVGPGDVPPPGIDLLYMRLMTAAPAVKGEAMERAQPVPLEEALKNRKLVIEGKPGGGKTTFVRWIAWMLCRPGGPPDTLAVRGFPLWIRISELDQHITKTLECREAGDPRIYADAGWIANFLASGPWELGAAYFRQKLSAPDTLLLLDGLDEAANHARREAMVAMIQMVAVTCKCHVVVTTRPGAHEGPTALAGFEKASIDDLDDAGIGSFLLQWCRWLKKGDEAAAQGYYAELRPSLAVPNIRILARNPLMLTALAVLHLRQHKLPEQRAQLYEQIMDWLADQAVKKHPEYPKDELLSQFGRLALAMQEWKGGQKLQIGLDTAAQLLTATDRHVGPVRQFLELAQIYSGILTLRGGEIAFWHRSFQEYLVARTLSGFPDKKLGEAAVKFLYAPEGREVLPLLAGCMVGTARERLNDLFETLTEDAVAQMSLERKAHAAGVLGNMLSDLAPAKYELSGAAQLPHSRLRASVMAIFEKGRTTGVGLKTRVAAAESLDQASQTRLRTPDAPDYWVKIMGGRLPSRRGEVPTFRIGRFPVTVWEYGNYLDQTDVAPPAKWDEQMRHPSRPVTQVTWHDAERYCKWASRKWRIRCGLPDEAEWEFAARGPEGRSYPWGTKRQEPDDYTANFDLNVGRPTPVGMFPDGNTREGVADMAGNVWEWSRSDYDAESKVLRGASYSTDASSLRTSIRRCLEPSSTSGDIGFRCVRE